ncbi:hypothetical protein NA644_19720 [Pseudomonas stutzeri]|uniref:hypothetical protein n=1 Tax=Stutzerimonas stutzeri TaxID=316 RepID=UPI0011AF0A8F|nr:hypothetical protein [Stutzerimonas stutzeri]MCQ4251543.1 hypothetical protein [Stutzerimonas stutzeri]
MEIQIAWATVLKIFGLGILTYVITPLLLTARDLILWLCINKLIITSNTRKMIHEFTLDRAWIDCSGVTPFKILGSGENQKFFLGNREVTPEVWVHQKEHWEKTVEKTAIQESRIKSTEKRIDRILKHYKQDEQNPVRIQREKAYEIWCKSFQIEDKTLSKNSPSEVVV